MKLKEIRTNIEKLVNFQLKTKKFFSTMLWGPPGIGKSSVVRQIADEMQIGFIDVRLSQLAPTDLRGIPTIDKEKNILHWAAPDFLPRDPNSQGIFFLDEFNMATSVLMGVSQELILDRRVGDYKLPDGWVIVAAGNRAEDRAAVNALPAPVANRFIHFSAEACLEEYKDLLYNFFEFSDKAKSEIIGFLNFRPELLYKNTKASKDMAFPTPRSWEMAGNLLDLDVDIAHAVGEDTSIQFRAYQKVYSKIPNLMDILEGEDVTCENLSDPSTTTAIISGLVAQAKTPEHFSNALGWLLRQDITEDYVGLYLKDMILSLNNKQALLAKAIGLIMKSPDTKDFINKYKQLIVGFGK